MQRKAIEYKENQPHSSDLERGERDLDERRSSVRIRSEDSSDSMDSMDSMDTADSTESLHSGSSERNDRNEGTAPHQYDTSDSHQRGQDRTASSVTESGRSGSGSAGSSRSEDGESHEKSVAELALEEHYGANDDAQPVASHSVDSQAPSGGDVVAYGLMGSSHVDRLDHSVSIVIEGDEVRITLKGRTDSWFGFGFDSSTMEGTYAIIASSQGVREHFLKKMTLDQSENAVYPEGIAIAMDEIVGEHRIVEVTRPRHSEYFSFPDEERTISIVYAKGTGTQELGYHGYENRGTEKLDLVETLGIGSGSGGQDNAPRPTRHSSDRRRSSSSSSSRGSVGRSRTGHSVDSASFLNADCVWDGGGNGDPSYYIELCSSYSESECISSRNGFLDGRCVWLGGRHQEEDAQEDVASGSGASDRASPARQPRQQRAAPRSSRSNNGKRSRRGPRPSQRVAAVLNFETVETVDERPFTMSLDHLDLRMAVALCALVVLTVLAAHRVCRRCRRRTLSEGAKTREDEHGGYALLV